MKAIQNLIESIIHNCISVSEIRIGQTAEITIGEMPFIESIKQRFILLTVSIDGSKETHKK